jgi:hypothetical protein
MLLLPVVPQVLPLPHLRLQLLQRLVALLQGGEHLGLLLGDLDVGELQAWQAEYDMLASGDCTGCQFASCDMATCKPAP